MESDGLLIALEGPAFKLVDSNTEIKNPIEDFREYDLPDDEIEVHEDTKISGTHRLYLDVGYTAYPLEHIGIGRNEDKRVLDSNDFRTLFMAYNLGTDWEPYDFDDWIVEVGIDAKNIYECAKLRAREEETDVARILTEWVNHPCFSERTDTVFAQFDVERPV